MHDQSSKEPYEPGVAGSFDDRADRSIDDVDPPAQDAAPANPTSEPPRAGERDPVAVALGRRGGLKGGRARAEQLSPEQRRAIAQRAAQARWGTKPSAPTTADADLVIKEAPRAIGPGRAPEIEAPRSSSEPPLFDRN